MDRNYDTRDAQEHADVTSVLASLPPEHPARVAYAERADTIRLTHLVADDPKLIANLKDAYLSGYRRMWDRAGGHFRP